MPSLSGTEEDEGRPMPSLTRAKPFPLDVEQQYKIVKATSKGLKPIWPGARDFEARGHTQRLRSSLPDRFLAYFFLYKQ